MATALMKNSKKGRSDSDLARIARRIVPVSELNDKVSFCIYARNKVGKTRFACSSERKTLLIDCREKGTPSVRHRKNVWVIRVKSWTDMEPIYWYLKNGDHEFEVVVIDTITMLAALGLKYVLHEQDERDMNREPKVPDQRSWGKLGQYMEEVIIRFRDLTDSSVTAKPVNVIFLAQEKTTLGESEDGAPTKEIHPELSPKPRTALLSAVSVIGRLYVKEVTKKNKPVKERRMLLGSHDTYVAGNRFEELKYVERNPNLEDFLTRIEGEMNG